MKQIVAAILGYGVVGQGVGELLTGEAQESLQDEGLSVELRYCLDRSTDQDVPLRHLLVTDIAEILDDPEVDVICEAMGGVTDSYDYTKRALAAGIHVVTSNKALVALHGQELLELAAQNNVRYLYEAAVGGGIPLLRNLRSSFPATRIQRVAGVLNGTSNYILTQMATAGSSFEEALQQAQALGYAESDPADDIEGTDSARKLAIIASLLTAAAVPTERVRRWGITHLTAEVFQLAKALKLTLRHVALLEARGRSQQIDLMVAPMLLDPAHELAVAKGVGNAVVVETPGTGSYLFAGPGAGGLPTASALVADVLSCFSQKVATPFIERWDQPVDAILTADLQMPCHAVILVAPPAWQQATELHGQFRELELPELAIGSTVIETPEAGYTEEQLVQDLEILTRGAGPAPIVLRYLKQ